MVVSKLEKRGGPIVGVSPYSKQLFSYSGAISHLTGLGIRGFSMLLRTNRFNDNHSIISNVAWYNITQKRGAVTYSCSKLGLFTYYPYYQGSDCINRIDNTYNSSLSFSKVFKIANTNTKSYNGLQNTSIENTITYDAYNNPLVSVLLTKENNTIIKTDINIIEYEHNLTGTTLNNPYYIGKITKKQTNSIVGSDNFTTIYL